MNIQPININNTKPNYNNHYSTNLNFQNKLYKDTVSFSGGEKLLKQGEWSNTISHMVTKKIAEEAQGDLKLLLTLLRRNLKTLVKSELHPDAPIAPNGYGIKGRIKDAASIMEKAETRKLYSKKEIEKMGDIVGARISLVHGTQDAFDKVLMELGKMVKNGDLKIKEIENYRLTRQQSFVSSTTLDKLESICHKCGLNPSRTGQTIPSGYTAVHLTIELPNGKPAEIQIMTREMETIKDIEDFYYKRRCNKHLNPRYKTIEELIDSKTANFTNFQKETLNMYIKDSYLHAIELSKETGNKTSKIKKFIDFPYSLPKELSFAELAKMKERCDRLAKESAK